MTQSTIEANSYSSERIYIFLLSSCISSIGRKTSSRRTEFSSPYISEDADYETRTDKAHCFYGSVPTSQENGGNVADSKFMKRLKFNNEFLLRLYIAILKEIVIPCLNFKIRICSRIVEVLEMEE
jgi:hypothetical protein